MFLFCSITPSKQNFEPAIKTQFLNTDAYSSYKIKLKQLHVIGFDHSLKLLSCANWTKIHSSRYDLRLRIDWSLNVCTSKEKNGWFDFHSISVTFTWPTSPLLDRAVRIHSKNSELRKKQNDLQVELDKFEKNLC